MPNPGYAANNQGKIAAAVILRELSGQDPLEPSSASTYYGLITSDYGVSIAAVCASTKTERRRRSKAPGVPVRSVSLQPSAAARPRKPAPGAPGSPRTFGSRPPTISQPL